MDEWGVKAWYYVEKIPPRARVKEFIHKHSAE